MSNITILNSKEFTTPTILLSIPENIATIHNLRSSSDGVWVKYGDANTFKGVDVYQIKISEDWVSIISDKFHITLYAEGFTHLIIF